MMLWSAGGCCCGSCDCNAVAVNDPDWSGINSTTGEIINNATITVDLDRPDWRIEMVVSDVDPENLTYRWAFGPVEVLVQPDIQQMPASQEWLAVRFAETIEYEHVDVTNHPSRRTAFENSTGFKVTLSAFKLDDDFVQYTFTINNEPENNYTEAWTFKKQISELDPSLYDPAATTLDISLDGPMTLDSLCLGYVYRNENKTVECISTAPQDEPRYCQLPGPTFTSSGQSGQGGAIHGNLPYVLADCQFTIDGTPSYTVTYEYDGPYWRLGPRNTPPSSRHRQLT